MKKLNLYFIFPALILFMTGNYTMAQTLQLLPTDDATVFETMPDETANFLNDANIFVGEATDSAVISFIKFDISKFTGRVVESAVFSTRSDMQDGKTMTVKLTKGGTGFSRDTTTWNNKPSSKGELATVVYDEESTRKEFAGVDGNLVDYINEKLAAGADEIAFGLEYKAGDGDQLKWIGGKANGASWGPNLDITFNGKYSSYGIDDATVFEAIPDATANVQDANNIFVGKASDSTVIAYVKFDISSISGQFVNKVDFSTRSDMQDGTTMTVKLTKADNGFSRDTTTWNNKPSSSGELATAVYDENSARKYFTPLGTALSDYVNEQLLLGKDDLAFAIEFKSGDGDMFKWAGGVGNGTWGPLLEMEFGAGNPSLNMVPTSDATVFEAMPDATANEKDANNIFVGEATDSTVISYVKFDISALAGKVVEKADFSTRSDMQDDQTMTVKLTKADPGFQRDTTTWANKPSSSGELATAIYDMNSAPKTFVPVDNKLVDYINEKLIAGETELAFGLAYKDGAGDQLKWIGGKGNGSWGPMLNLTFSNSYSVYPSNDATVFEAVPDATANLLDSKNIFVGEATDSTVISYVKFPLNNLTGKEVSVAQFSTRSDMQDDQTMTVKLTKAGTDFSRDTTTWNNKPSSSGELATAIYDMDSSPKIFTSVGSNLTDYINEQIATGATEVAFGLEYKDGAGNQLKWIGGKANGSWGPKLELEFAQPVQNDTLTNIADAFVDEESPDDNFGSAADMKIRKDNDNNTNKEVLLKFDISELSDAVVGSAKLAIYIAQHNSGTERDEFLAVVYAVDDVSWQEYDVTWNTKPETGSKLLEADVDWFNSGKDTKWTSSDFTHYVNDAIKAGKDSIAFTIKGKDNTPGDRLWMAGKDWKNGARLILDYTVEPPIQQMPSIADAYVSEVEGEKDTNFGGEADQHLIKDETNGSKWNYFMYDISDAYGEVVSAELKAYGSIHNSNNLQRFEFLFFGTANCDWQEDAITWNNKINPGTNVLLEGTLVQGGKWYNLGSPEFTEFINEAIENGDTCVTLVAKGKNNQDGKRAWFSGKEWRGSSLLLNYEPQVQTPIVLPAGGSFIKEAEVEVTSLTSNSTVYYTTDGSIPDDNSTEYTGPITLTDTTVLSVIAYAPDLKPSSVVSHVFNVTPVGKPEFSPSPVVKYPDSVTVTISVVPEDAVIRYSTDGSEPTTIYQGPIFLDDDAVIKAQAYSADFTFSTEIIEASYDIIPTNLDPGVGPGGVGYKDLTRVGQPEMALWLKPEGLSASEGDEITTWPDMSGNENVAYNTYEEGGDNKIENTGEKEKPAPVFRENALNGKPVLEFGATEGEKGSLIVDDADNLDGSSSISLFIVFKRNEMFGDFAAILQKRDISADKSQEAYTLEMNGGSNPNEMQVVFNKKLFLQNDQIINTEDYYIVNAAVNGNTELASFMTNGLVENSAAFSDVLNNSHAPVIVGGFQAMNIAEVLSFNSPVNHAQTTIINNYLAAKYGLELTDGANTTNLYTDDSYIHDLIGVGKTKDLDNSTIVEHNYSSGGGLEMQGLTLAEEAFVFAGHNGASVSSADNWERKWNIETTGDAADVKFFFDFEAVGLSSPSAAEGYVLKYDDGSGAVNLDAEPGLNDGRIVFTVSGIANGIYSLAKEGAPDVVTTPVFSLAEGTYEDAQSVEITCDTEGATIYYTTDGTDPDESSNEYSGAISVNQTTTIKAKAYAEDMTPSSIATADYTITAIDLPDLSASLSLYPVPAEDKLYVSLNNKVYGKLKIYVRNILGKENLIIRTEKTNSTFLHEIDVSDLEAGCYSVEILVNNKRAVKTLIVR